MDSQRFQHLHEVSFLKRSCDQDPLLEQEAANRSPVATKDHPNTNSGTDITHIILFSALSETHCIGNLYPHWVCSAPVQIVTPSDLTQLGPLKISKTTSGRFWSWLSSIKNMDTENHCHSITFQLNLTLKDPSSHPSCSKEVKVWASCRGHASQLIK